MAWTAAQTTVYSKILSATVQEKLVFKNAVDFTWVNDARQNKVVTINALTLPTAYTYTADMGNISSSAIAYTSQNLTMDQYKYCNVGIDDILKFTSNIHQAQPVIDQIGYVLAEAQDAAIAAQWSNISETNWIQSGSSFLVNNAFTETASSGSAYDVIVNLKVKLMESHAPRTGLYVIAPQWFIADCEKDSTFAAFSPEVRANGVMGSINGMTLLQSENIVNANSIYNVLAVHSSCIAFAGGIQTFETIRSEKEFKDYIRALAVYGLKVVNPTWGAVAFCKKG